MFLPDVQRRATLQSKDIPHLDVLFEESDPYPGQGGRFPGENAKGPAIDHGDAHFLSLSLHRPLCIFPGETNRQHAPLARHAIQNQAARADYPHGVLQG